MSACIRLGTTGCPEVSGFLEVGPERARCLGKSEGAPLALDFG